ncbi:MAG: hypothetical protein ACE5I5_19685, partial [Candidatus Heimdallarchaeota archaeon]
RWNPHRGQSGVTTGLPPVSSKVNLVVQDRGFKDWEGRNSSPRFRRASSCDRSDKHGQLVQKLEFNRLTSKIRIYRAIGGIEFC